MKAAGITLSTVGAGGGSNPFLQGLAQQGGGRFYDAANPASIPDIFLKETQQVSGQQIVEEPFFPILTSSSPILRGLDDGLPRLRGYNGTTAKPAAQTVLVTARDDPLLAQWQYGLGRSVAWTSDSTGRWARDWLGWDGLLALLQPARRHGPSRARRPAGSRPRSTPRAARRRSTSRAWRRMARRATSTRPPRSSSGPTSRPPTSTSCRSRRACTRSRSARSIPGAYGVRITQTRPGSTPLGRTVGLVAPTAAEYRLLGTQRAAPDVAPHRDRRKRDRDPARPLDPRPADHVPLDRPVAAAPGPRPGPLAARHRPAARLGRAPGVRSSGRVGPRRAAATAHDRGPDRDKRKHARDARTRDLGGDAFRAASHARCGRHAARSDGDTPGAGDTRRGAIGRTSIAGGRYPRTGCRRGTTDRGTTSPSGYAGPRTRGAGSRHPCASA